MITYLPERQLVVCENAGMAYVVYINAEGYLETVYYGRPLADYGDFDAVRNAHDYSITEISYFFNSLINS